MLRMPQSSVSHIGARQFTVQDRATSLPSSCAFSLLDNCCQYANMIMIKPHCLAVPCNRSCNRHVPITLTPRKQPTAPCIMRAGSLLCRYTSIPERMGEEDNNASAAVPDGADAPEELHNRDEARRARDKAEQDRATNLLHDLETAAVAANSEAGHPETRRALDATDYPPPAPRPTEPAGCGNWIEPQVAQGLPWLGVNSSSAEMMQRSNSPESSSREAQSGDGICDDGGQL